MNVLIIEDEAPAADKLENMLRELNPGIKVLAKLKSVKESIKWFSENKSPEAAFVDVQLSDESSFELFRIIQPDFPVIFTTAFDDYVLKSFEYNSIDYLLKPYSKEKLKRALQKMNTLESVFVRKKLNEITGENLCRDYKSRFIVKKGLENIALKPEDISYFFSEFKITFIRDFNRNKYIIDNSLSELMCVLNPEIFFRANRQYIVNKNSIVKFKTESGKIILSLTPETDDVTVSKENAAEFRKWIKESK
ncbi:MAG: LytTR family DNA-binding domain-containing protein [Ignavibacteria bacterium]|nr:LytTR family DNA-binding domain-containing protein [Ignavibacteria bacterium]